MSIEVHPFVLAADCVLQYPGGILVLMEYVPPDVMEKVSLADHLAGSTGPLDADRVLRLAIQSCYGMEHANRCGVNCHRDIKPSNILITDDDTPKITDFGLARAANLAGAGTTRSLVTRTEGTGVSFSFFQSNGMGMCGTPGYMAPEVFLGQAAGLESDIYSFGVVLWQMANGSASTPFDVPYRGNIEDYMREVLEQQQKGQVSPVDGPLNAVIQRCLMPNPSDRHRSFEELRGDLEPILRRLTGEVVELQLRRRYRELLRCEATPPESKTWPLPS